jgi:hypothetical protein
MSSLEVPDRFRDRQVPVGDEIFLDHTGHFVESLDEAGARLQRLGFLPSAVNLQTNLGEDGVTRPSGPSNRLVHLRRGFLEFLAACGLGLRMHLAATWDFMTQATLRWKRSDATPSRERTPYEGRC